MIRLSTKVGEQFRMPDIGEREVGIEIEMESFVSDVSHQADLRLQGVVFF